MGNEKLKEYREYLDKEAVKFKLTGNDLTNLFDLFYFVDDNILEDNSMKEWADEFLYRLSKVVIKEKNE